MTPTTTSLSRRLEVGAKSRPITSLIGSKAQKILRAKGQSGKVIVASSRAAYVLADSGDIFAICPTNQQPHPRSLLSDLDLSQLHVGLRVWVQDDTLNFGNGITLDLQNALTWERLPQPTSFNIPIGQLGRRCKQLLNAAQDLHQGENLGLALPCFSGRPGNVKLANAASPVISAGLKQVVELLPLCRIGNMRDVLPMAQRMIGLGHGLTPSGDDFVGGLLFMRCQLQSGYPSVSRCGDDETKQFLNETEPMTSNISHALLTDLAEGQSHESLHELAEALFSKKPEFHPAHHVRNITQIGQSSGWDMLTGILAGLLPFIDNSQPRLPEPTAESNS